MPDRAWGPPLRGSCQRRPRDSELWYRLVGEAPWEPGASPPWARARVGTEPKRATHEPTLAHPRPSRPYVGFAGSPCTPRPWLGVPSVGRGLTG